MVERVQGEPRTWSMVEPPSPRENHNPKLNIASRRRQTRRVVINFRFQSKFQVSWVTICLQNVPLRDFRLLREARGKGREMGVEQSCCVKRGGDKEDVGGVTKTISRNIQVRAV